MQGYLNSQQNNRVLLGDVYAQFKGFFHRGNLLAEVK